MVREQLMPASRGIVDPRVLAAMRRVPRHAFVPARLQSQAYADHPVPIGCGQTISQPFIVALMTQMLELLPVHRVLEVGTGCGYQAAVLARLAGEVFSIERCPELAAQAMDRLAEFAPRVWLRQGDGWKGWPEHAPYDRILVTCAPDEVPPALIEQLADPGMMVLPVGPPHGVQQLMRVIKQDGQLDCEMHDPVCFVPMVRGESRKLKAES